MIYNYNVINCLHIILYINEDKIILGTIFKKIINGLSIELYEQIKIEINPLVFI